MLSFLKSDSITPGSSYRFKVKAKNLHGWGVFSDSITLLASGKPDTPAKPTTSISNNLVRITWTQPSNNFESITSYKVLIKHSDSSYSENSLYCNGNNLLIYSQRFCEIPMQVFTSSPYLLIAGTIIEANV